MKKSHLGLGLLLGVAVAGACFSGCGDDDTTTTGPGAGGSAGSAGRGGSAGSTGGNAGSGGSTGGSGGSTGGSAGGRTDAGDAGDANNECNLPGVSHTKPTVPAAIDVPAGSQLVGGYFASGYQVYTCTPRADAGSGGDAADAAPAGNWTITADALLTGDNCSKVADHFFTGTSPNWKATDGSTVVGARVDSVPAPVADGGDAGATAIQWVLLRAASNSGEGIYGNVTYIQRVDTVGGIGPSGACDPGEADPQRHVHYTAVYYFYTGGTGEAGTPDSATTPDSGGGD